VDSGGRVSGALVEGQAATLQGGSRDIFCWEHLAKPGTLDTQHTEVVDSRDRPHQAQDAHTIALLVHLEHRRPGKWARDRDMTEVQRAPRVLWLHYNLQV